ncbi:MAG: HAMP domain-containing protein [Flavobacteriales bacterium]|nr:HAMP domain-containing protein [Flavobacteriales bacterium]
MQLRQRLTYLFVIIVALVLLVFSIAVYTLSADYRHDDFYNRLQSKASNTAKLLIEVEEIDANLLRKMEKDNPVSLPKEEILIYNYRNELVYSSNEKSQIHINTELLDKIRLEEEVQFTQEKYEVLGFLYTGQYDRFAVIAAAEDIYGLRKLANLRTVIFIAFGVSVVIVFFLGWVFAGRALRPISRVIRQVENITITSLNLRVDEGNGQDEIAKVARTFNEMLDRLEAAFKMQKNFIANASHELRTPLTAITGQLEVLLMKERDNETYRKTVESVLEDIKGLNTISNRLLLLAQASTEISRSEFKPIRLDDIIWQVRSELIKRNPGYQIDISLDSGMDNDDRLTVSGVENLIKTVVMNLIENGCKYGESGKVEVLLGENKGMMEVRVIDKGIGIEAADIDRIFEPFHRGKNVMGISGHGIGLSLVARIVALHGGEIKVYSKVGEGSTFLLMLPLA